MPEIKEYVLCYVDPTECEVHDVLLIEKKKPAWQAGRFNLPGGSIEPGETPHEAAVRELHEETGLACEVSEVTLMGTIEGPGFVVYCMHCEYDGRGHEDEIESKTDERVFWMTLHELTRDPRVIGNLLFIVPLIICGVTGWTLNLGEDSDIGPFILSLKREDAVASS